MNIRLIMRLASIFALSSIRAKRAKGSIPKGFAKSPIVNIIVSVAGFPLAVILAYLFIARIIESEAFIYLTCTQLLIFLPSFTALLSIMFSLMFEFSQSSSAASTDMINWLPIGAREYVLGSALCTMYFTSPILSLILGVSLGLAIYTGMTTVWVLVATLSFLGAFLGAFAIEVVRALINRASATLYKRGGKFTMVIRLLTSIILIAMFSIMFNINILQTFIQWFVGNISNAWFIPMLWPSLAIMNFIQADLTWTTVYTLLSVTFTSAFLWISVKTREKYWVPVPVSIKLAPPKIYTPKKGFLGIFGFTAAETALIRKDLRSLIRRKEMASWIAIPAIMCIITIITTPWNPTASTMYKMLFFMTPGFGILLLAFFLALVGIGQEGSAFVNLLTAPLRAKQIVVAKLAVALFPSTCALSILIVFVQVLVQPRLEVMLAVTVAGFTALLETTLVGLAVGARYPDFTEVPRARFVSQQGALLGMALMGATVAATCSPILAYSFFPSRFLSLPMATVVAATIAIATCYLGYRAAMLVVQQLCRRG